MVAEGYNNKMENRAQLDSEVAAPVQLGSFCTAVDNNTLIEKGAAASSSN